MESRVGWALTAVAAFALLLATGVFWNGYKNQPHRRTLPAAAAAAGEQDPLSPKLFDQSGAVRVHVAGAVRKPDVYSLPVWARVADAVKKAGGPTASADLDAINLADRIRDGEQIRIPVKGRPETIAAHRPTPDPAPLEATVGGVSMGRYPFASRSGRSVKTAPPAGPVNLNTASPQQLDALPGIGPATAARIVAYRMEHGPYQRTADLMNVKGIGEKKLAKLLPYITAP